MLPKNKVEFGLKNQGFPTDFSWEEEGEKERERRREKEYGRERGERKRGKKSIFFYF